MPTIVFVSPKGGVGRTTAALLLASELARGGAAITVVDAVAQTPFVAADQHAHDRAVLLYAARTTNQAETA